LSQIGRYFKAADQVNFFLPSLPKWLKKLPKTF
jgi:hypothetical protein